MAKTLRLGSHGPEVKEIQIRLHLIDDGIFGPITEEAVKDFQMRQGLWPDGIAGPETLKALGLQPSGSRYVNMIIVHCTATPEGENFTVKQIRKMHLERGFSDIGYHFLIDLDGNIHKGRPLELAGAHTSGHNAHSVGVCYVGGCPPRSVKDWQHKSKDTRTLDQKAALREIIGRLKKLFPSATVHGHYEFANKDCPSFKICDL